MGLMSFLKGLFGGNRDPLDDEEPQHQLPIGTSHGNGHGAGHGQSQSFAQASVRVPTPAPTPEPAPVTTPTFRLATRYSTTVDFSAVLQNAGVDAEQQQRVKKAQDLLRSLPESSPAALKRQIVEAAFTAFDVPTQKIIDAATTEVIALEAFIDAGGATTQRTIDEGTARIAELDAEIATIRESMAAAVADQAVRDASTLEQIAGVKPILAFFAQSQKSGPSFSQVHVRPPNTDPKLDFFSQPPAAATGLADVIDDVDFD